MTTIAGIDTTKVYHEFNFHSDQVVGLKCEQWFIHVDLVMGIEEVLNRFTEWNAIKILYSQIHYFGLDHVKCLEIYCENFQSNRNYIPNLQGIYSIAQYKMFWKGATIYFSRRFQQRIEEKLKKENLLIYLINSYDMKVDWLIEHSLKVYEFKHDLNREQKLILDSIFEMKDSIEPPIFISPNYLFLNITKPPLIFKSEILVAYHGQFLPDLNIQDILALELANKDHRIPYYNHELDHDIQMHLQKRLPMFYKNKNFKTYFANEFTNIKLLKYFIFKYRHCISKLIIPHQLLSSKDFDLIKYENKKIKFNTLEDSNIRVNIMSPNNEIVCSMIYRTSADIIDLSNNSVPLTVKHIYLDEDINFNFIYFNAKSFPYIYKYSYIEILIRTDYSPANLSVLIHKLLERIEKVSKIENATISLSALPNNIDISKIMKIFLNRPVNYKMEFKSITFYSHSLQKWLYKIKTVNLLCFIECQILLIRKPNKLPRTKSEQYRKIYNNPNFVLEFRNMNIDLYLPISGHTIVYDNCRIIPSEYLEPIWNSVDTVYFKNMTVELYTIMSLQYSKLVFERCQIVSLLTSDIMVEPLLQTTRHKKKVKLSFNRPVISFKITFKNMNIEIKTLYNISYKFNDLIFENSRILHTDNFVPEISMKFRDLRFTEMPITPELKNNLKYFEVITPIEFHNCQITNKNLLEIWKIKQDQRLSISGRHQINGYFYIDLAAMLHENRLDQLHFQFKDGFDIPFKNSIKIEWKRTLFRLINWNNIKIRSVLVNDATIKLEYLQNDVVIDFFDELNELPDHSGECEVRYY